MAVQDYSKSPVHVLESIAKVASGMTVLTGAFGTPGSAIADVTGAFSQTILNNNFRALEDKVNALITGLQVD